MHAATGPPAASGRRDTGAPVFDAAYRSLVRRRLALVVLLGVAAMASALLDVATGPSGLGIAGVVAGLADPASMSAAERVILFDVRLPYAVMAVVVGAALGLAGAETQTVLNNPLASPYTLGISWAAILGATLAIVFDLDVAGLGRAVSLPLAAFLFAALAGGLILLLAARFGPSTETIILFGIALLFTCSALISLLQFVADAEDVQESVMWSMGSLTQSSWRAIAAVTATLIVALPLALRASWALTLLRSGEEHARGVGVSVHRLRLGALLRTSLLAGTAVAFVGAIGFVGLVAPHITRLLVGEEQRLYLCGSLATGALLLSLASVGSKTIVPGVLIPVGIITALIGIPAFVTLIVAERSHR